MASDFFLGNLTLNSAPQRSVAVSLAPMSGVTDVVFRRTCLRFGASFVVTEMVAADGLLSGQAEARLRSEGSGIHPHAVQLVGRDPSRMAEAARIAESSGAEVVDINLGCPAKRVTGGLAGSALMREPDLAERIVTGVVRACSVPVTVKMRLGWDERSINAPDLTSRFAAAGVRSATVHGRTRQQFYKGAADWSAIADVVRASPIPVTVNGDISSADVARSALELSGAAAVMIGRAALGQPWLLGAIAASLAGRTHRLPPPSVRMAAAIEHFEGLLTLYGREVGLRHSRKHLAAYTDRASEAGLGLPQPDRLQLVTSDDPATIVRLLGRIYDAPIRRAA